MLFFILILFWNFNFIQNEFLYYDFVENDFKEFCFL